MKNVEMNMYRSLTMLEEKNIDYKILDISKNASMNDIKAAYKRKAKIYHPDRRVVIIKFRLITMAYMSIWKNIKDYNKINSSQLLKKNLKRNGETK